MAKEKKKTLQPFTYIRFFKIVIQYLKNNGLCKDFRFLTVTLFLQYDRLENILWSNFKSYKRFLQFFVMIKPVDKNIGMYKELLFDIPKVLCVI